MTTRHELATRLVDRAREDEAFRALLLTDPREAIADEVGRPVPDGFRVEVLEAKPRTMYLVVPAAGELEDADLDRVTGGVGGPGTSVEDGACGPWFLEKEGAPNPTYD